MNYLIVCELWYPIDNLEDIKIIMEYITMEYEDFLRYKGTIDENYHVMDNFVSTSYLFAPRYDISMDIRDELQAVIDFLIWMHNLPKRCVCWIKKQDLRSEYPT